VPTRPAWSRTLGHQALALAAALAVGWPLGHPWPALAMAALGVAAWHCWRLHGVLARLQSHQWPPSATGRGAWDELERQLRLNQDGMRARNRRLVAMLRAYGAVAAALPDAVVVIERNSQRVQWFNDAATALLGLEYPRDLGEPLLDVASPASPEVRLNLRLIPYSEDMWLVVARDVTKMMRLEQVRRDFVANVSHELRTPLTVVHGYLDMLEPDDQPEWAPMLREMQRQSQRMTRLVEDLLTLSRLEAQEGVEDATVAMEPMLSTLRRE